MLVMIIVVSSIILVATVLGALIAMNLIGGAAGVRFSQDALGKARSGIDDGIIRVVRRKNCPGTAGCPPECPITEQVPLFGNHTADICVYENLDGTLTLQSTASAFTRKKRVEAILAIDALTGEVRVQSFKEVAL